MYCSILLCLEEALLPYYVLGRLLRPMDWGSLEVVAEGFQPLWCSCCDQSVVWLELSWHLMAWEKGRGLEKDEEDARWRTRRKERPQSHTVNRLKALRHSW